MPRKRGDGEGELRIRVLAGRKVWWARWCAWDGDHRRRPKRIIGTVSEFPTKREARAELTRIIKEETGATAKIERHPTFEQVWTRYFDLVKPRWSKGHIASIEPLMRRAVLPVIGARLVSELTHEPLQAALNHMAGQSIRIGTGDDATTREGYSRSAIDKARTYIAAVFEFAIAERLIDRSPAKNLKAPETRDRCERYLTLDEVGKLLYGAPARERLILNLFLTCGLRPGELFALRTNDIQPGSLRVDEAVKEREARSSKARLGRTKTKASMASVALPPRLEQSMRTWAEFLPEGGLLFPTETGSTWGIGNYLRRVLQPLAERAGVSGVTHQALRRTAATHFQTHGTVKDAQSQLRHADPTVTLRYYTKSIPESLKASVEAMDQVFQEAERRVQ